MNRNRNNNTLRGVTRFRMLAACVRKNVTSFAYALSARIARPAPCGLYFRVAGRAILADRAAP